MTAHQMLVKVRNLPPISKAALELGSLLGRPETTNEEVVRVLKQDSVLTARLLRACNSPAFGLKEQVTSIDQAVFLLGHSQISQMVTTLAFRGPLAMPLQAYALETDDLWRHSILTATAAEIVSKESEELGFDSSLAYTAGLLHDLGKLITNEFLTRQSMIAIRQQTNEGRCLAQAERDVLGADHAEVGAALLYLWRLPDALVEAVAKHHQPVVEPQPRLSAVASLADTLAHRAAAAQAGREPHPDDNGTLLLDAFGFDPGNLDSLLARVAEPPALAEECLAISA